MAPTTPTMDTKAKARAVAASEDRGLPEKLSVAMEGWAAAEARAVAAEARTVAAEAHGVAQETRAAVELARALARDDARMVAREETRAFAEESRAFTRQELRELVRQEAQALLARDEEDRAAAREGREFARSAHERALVQEERDKAAHERAIARSIVDETRAAAREAREVFVHGATKIKDMLHPTTVLMVLLYASVIGFSLQARGWRYSVSHPMPVGDDMYHVGNGTNPYAKYAEDQWTTDGTVVFANTIICFIAYTIVHIILLAHIRVKAHSNPSPWVKMAYAYLAPFGFFCVGFAYIVTYVSLARYTSIKKDWIVGLVFSIILFVFTCIFAVVPLSTKYIMDHQANV